MNFRERINFGFKEVEQGLFESPTVQSFFSKWCEINGPTELRVVSRTEWEENRENIFKELPSGKKVLFIPSDLKLWEVIGVVEAIDKNTFVDNPKRKLEAKEKLLAFANLLQNTGVYIAKRLKAISEGREIAEALAQEFYDYGKSLKEDKKYEFATNVDDIISQNLTPEETEAVDHFLAGDALYESRQKRAERATVNDSKKEEIYEQERQKTLAQFFRVAKKALLLEEKDLNGELAKKRSLRLNPWQSNTPIHSAFLRKIEEAIRQEIETPKRELEKAIFRRGLKELVEKMKESSKMRRNRMKEVMPEWMVILNELLTKLGFDIDFEQKKLADSLELKKLKAELDRARKSGNLEKISRKEREIADKIQNAVSTFPYRVNANNPSEMIAEQYINCVGASILGGALMKEVGLNYLVGSLPGHSVLLLVASDGQVELRDMLKKPSSNLKLTDEIIKGQKENGLPITLEDIVKFSQKPKATGLTFDIKEKTNKNFSLEEGNKHPYRVVVFGAEDGQLAQLLHNTGQLVFQKMGLLEEAAVAHKEAIRFALRDFHPHHSLGNIFYLLGFYKEAIKFFREAIKINPWYSLSYNNLGKTFSELGRFEEAIELYQKAISINPDDAFYYSNLGDAFSAINQDERAIKAFRQAIMLQPREPIFYLKIGDVFLKLGRDKEAIRAYKRFIKLASRFADKENKNSIGKLIERVEEKVIKLENKENVDL